MMDDWASSASSDNKLVTQDASEGGIEWQVFFGPRPEVRAKRLSR